jgi:ABC-type bacteriocin/lantibiotic exporter with double-glycine peptidase domain
MAAERPPEPDETPLAERFPALRQLGRGGRRIPVVQQLSATECGAACLTMVLGYFGKRVPLEDVRETCSVNRDGVSALTLLNAANLYGLRGRGVKLEIEELELIAPGTILHWEFNHFVVFEQLRRNAVDIVDPALGRRRVPMELFRKQFTGVALVLEPGDGFAPEERQRNHLWPAVRQVLGKTGLLPRILVTSLMVQLAALAVPLLTVQLVDAVVPRADEHLLAVLATGVGAMVLFDFIATLVRGHLLLHLRTLVDARMTLGFIDHLTNLPYSYFQLRSAGDLMMRLNSNSTVREILTSSVLSGVLDGLMVILYLGIMLAISPLMGAIVVACGMANVAVYLFSRRRQRDLAAKSLQTEAKSQSYQVELLTSMETLKAMGSEHRAVSHWSGLFVDVLNASLERGRLAATVEAATSALRLGSPLLILGIGALLVLDGKLSLGAMLAFDALAVGFLNPLSKLVDTALQLEMMGRYLERLNDVLDTPAEQDRVTARRAHRLGGHVALDRVSFRYGPLAPFVVQEVSLEVHPGQFVAVVGRSGAGKTTLAHLLIGLYRPTTGKILFDGVDLSELDLRSVRQQIGIVTQSHHLFGATIRDNIALADPSLPMSAVMEAAKLADIHDEIVAMPLGYHTLLVDRGASISGGQRQRLALARALVRKPAMLLLDEATSALDAVSEAKIHRALTELRCTRIVIAHRLSTVRRASLIVVMDQGRVIEAGSHEELLAAGGAYWELVAAQSGNEEA